MDDTIYDERGITPVINARGSITTLGGSLVPPAVREEMDRAAESFVRMGELMDWAGGRIADVTGAEAGLVTTGAAGGIVLAGAACLTGRDRDLMERLPDTAGVPDEFVVQHDHAIGFARGLRTAGGRLVEVGNASGTDPGDLAAAMGEDTAALFHVVLDPGPTVPLEEAVGIAHRHDVPVIVDAAAELPPAENLHAFLEAGADLVTVSGGKNIRGPNDTGLLFGGADRVAAARLQAFPNGGIGRPMKVSKEQIVGQVAALERWVDLDHEARQDRWHAMAEMVCESVADCSGVQPTVTTPDRGPRPLTIPRAKVLVDEAVVGCDVAEIGEALREGRPSIELWVEESADALWVNPEHLRDGEEAVVSRRLRAVIGEG